MIDEDLIYVLLGKRIKSKREAANLSQAQLADAIGKSRASLANYESGEQAIYISDLYLLAEELSVEIGDFLPSLDEIKEAALPDRHLEKYKEPTRKEIAAFIEDIEKEEGNG